VSFLEILIIFFIVFPLLAIWAWCLFHIIARPDMTVLSKVLWAVGILVLPLIGAIAYLIAYKKHGPVDETKKWEDKSAEEIEDEVFHAQHMTSSDRAQNTRLF
jgi:hypothetical protein